MATNEAGDTQALNIHHGVLGKSSTFFQRALKPEWTEWREKPDVIDVLDDSVQTVSIYVRWLYGGDIPVKLYKADQDAREKVAEEAEKVFVVLAEAYVFGEKINDTKYKDAVVRRIVAAIESSGWNLGPNSVGIIYNGTPCTSPLRRLVANNFATVAHDDSKGGFGWMDFIDAYPREALVDALKATVRVRPRPGRGTQYDIRTFLEEGNNERVQEEEEMKLA